uniref:Cytochrome b-c1 complex subunit 7 n=1 Tax=Octactis speculum TaxID=3111310 RepID=A0A7S2GXC5_9STRA
MALEMVGKRAWNVLAGGYQTMVIQRLNQYGLKYNDILNEALPDVQKAVSRLDPDMQQSRDRRIKRALDISFKKKPLPMDIQKKLFPLDPYIDSLLDEARELRLERELLNGPR